MKYSVPEVTISSFDIEDVIAVSGLTTTTTEPSTQIKPKSLMDVEVMQ